MEEKVVEALGENVVLLRKEAEQQSEGGIIIPDDAQRQQKLGTVYHVGIDVPAHWNLEEGETILFGGYAGHEQEIDGVMYLVVGYKEIAARIHERVLDDPPKSIDWSKA